jgi:hypothetical protein
MGLDMSFYEKDTKYYCNEFASARAYPIHEFIAKEVGLPNSNIYDFEITYDFFNKLLSYMKHDLYLISGMIINNDYFELKSLLLIPYYIDDRASCLVKLGSYHAELQNLIRDLSKIDIDKTKVCYSGDY